MKQVCIFCERATLDRNTYCQEVYCPAEMSPHVLGYGEWLGDIEIIKPVAILRSAVLYEATRQKTKVFLKVAHLGMEHKERLKREADFLRKLELAKEKNQYLPTLLPPYAHSTLQTDAVGKITFKEHLLYYYLFEHVEAEPLRDILQKNSQLWLTHVGWIMLQLTFGVAFLQSKGLVHFGLSPELVLIRFDETKPAKVPRVLLYDFGISSEAGNVKNNWYSSFTLPAYLAPELLDEKRIQADQSTDVYGLGLILYELLLGEPAFDFKLQSDAEIYEAIQQKRRARMNREDVTGDVIAMTIQAVNPQRERRLQNPTLFYQELLKNFTDVPIEKKSYRPTLSTLFNLVMGLLAVALVIVTAISLYNFI